MYRNSAFISNVILHSGRVEIMTLIIKIQYVIKNVIYPVNNKW